MGITFQTFLILIGAGVSSAWQLSTGSYRPPSHHRRIAFGRLLAKTSECDKYGSSWVENDAITVSDNIASRRRFLVQISGSLASSLMIPRMVTAEDTPETATIKAVENVLNEEKDLDSKLKQEESDETKSIEDTKKLISEIEETGGNKDEESLIAGEKRIADDTESLIKEEEQIVGETQAMITEIETMKSEARELDKDSTPNEGTESEEFVNKLKQRVEEKEDLITKLKRESELYRDPTTGKFKPMLQDEFKKRALETEREYDYVQILKDSLTKNEEFERDLEAFEGLLERNFGSIMKDLKKDESAAENEFDRIKESAGAVIEQIRKLF